MTEFYCDVLDTYIQRKFFESITTETFYVAASEKLDDNVKEKMKDEYLNNKSKHLVCNALMACLKENLGEDRCCFAK